LYKLKIKGATPQYLLLLLQSGNKFLSCYSGDLFFELLKYTLFNMKVLVVEDDVFVNSMLKQILESAGLSVNTVFDVPGALTSIAVTEPNVIITDLDLGDGPSGADLINIVSKKLPWVNIIVLSTHRNPALAIYPSSTLPPGINYITKGDLAHEQNLITIVKESMVSKSNLENHNLLGLPVLNSQQSEVLQLIAKGLTNQAIAEARGVSVRAAEILVAKVYEILEIDNDPSFNKRLKAAEIWRSGKVLTV